MSDREILRPATPEETQSYIRNFGTNLPVSDNTPDGSTLRQSWLSQGQTNRQKAIEKQNQSTILGISANIIPDDPQSLRDLVDQFNVKIGLSPMWDQVARDFPALSKSISSPSDLTALREDLPNMALTEKIAANYKLARAFNQKQDEIEKYARYAIGGQDPVFGSSDTSPMTSRESATNAMKVAMAEQEALIPPEFSFTYEGTKIAHFLTGLAKSAGGGWANEMATMAPALVGAGATLGEMAMPVGGGVPGALIGTALAAVGSLATGAGQGGLAYWSDINRAQSYADAIRKGAPANQHTANIANITGEFTALLQEAGGSALLGMGLNSAKVLLNTKSLPILAKMAEKSPMLSDLAREFSISPSKYINKPLYSALYDASKNIVESNVIMTGENYAQNLAINLASNKALHDAGLNDLTLPLSEIVTRSTEGLGTAALAALPLTILMGSVSGIGRYANAIHDARTADVITKAMAELSRENSVKDVLPDKVHEFRAHISDEHDISHIGIDRHDSDRLMKEAGIEPIDAYKRAGLDVLYQDAINNDSEFFEIPLDKFPALFDIPVHENKPIIDLIDGATRLHDDQYTKNKANEIEKYSKEIETQIDQVIKDQPNDVEQLRAIATTAVYDAMIQGKKDKRQVQIESKSNGELITRMLVRESIVSGRPLSEMIEHVFPQIFGPRELRGMSESRIRSEAWHDVKYDMENDAGYQFNSARINSKKPIYIPKENWNDFKTIAEKFPKRAFTLNPKDGIPWEQFFSELWNTADMNTILEKMDNARYKTSIDKKSEVESRVKRQISVISQIPTQEEGKAGAVNVKLLPPIVSVFSNYNSSTIMHEMAHIFLHDKLRFYRSGKGSDAYNKEFGILVNWLKITDKQKALSPLQQEAFADGFVSYLKNGEAPTVELRQTFRMFRIWFLNAYRTIRTIAMGGTLKWVKPDPQTEKLRSEGWIIDHDANIRLSPEIRGFFDRMLAADTEIENARRDTGDSETFISQLKKIGFSEGVINRLQKYRMDANETAFFSLWNEQQIEVSKNYEKEKNEIISKQRNENIRGSVADEMWNNSDYLYVKNYASDHMHGDRVGAFMRLQEITRGVISGLIKSTELIGADIQLKTKSLDKAAFILAGMKPPTEYLNDKLNEYVSDKLPNEFDAESFARRGQESYHNPSKFNEIVSEMILIKKMADKLSKEEFIQESAREVRHNAEYIKKAAEKALSMYTIDEIRKATRTLVTEERNAAVDTQRYFTEGKYTKAAISARSRALAHAKLSAANKLFKQAEIDQKNVRAAQLMTMKQLKAQNHFDAMFDLLATFGLGKKYENRRDSGTLEGWADENIGKVKQRPDVPAGTPTRFSDWLRSQDDPYLETVQIAPWIVDLAMKDEKRSYTQLTAGELHDFADAVANIKRFANNEAAFKSAELQEIIYQNKKAIMEQMTAEGVKVEELPQGSALMDYEKSFSYQVSLYANSAKKMFLTVENAIIAFLPHMDVTDNKLWRAMILPMREMATRFFDDNQHYQQEIVENMKYLNIKEMRATKTEYERKPGDRITLFDVLGMAHHYGSITNEDRLIKGLAMGDEKWTPELLKEILDKHMTKEMWDIVEKNWKTINSLWPKVKQVYEKLYGAAPAKVQGRIIETPFGEVQGGYMPLMLAKGQSRRVHANQIESVPILDASALMSMTHNGHTNERPESVNAYPVETNVQMIQQHISAVLRDVHYREHLRNLHFLVQDGDFKNLWRTKHGEPGLQSLRDWIAYIASDGRKEGEIGGVFIDPFISASTTGVMAWNFSMSVGDLASMIFQTSNKLGWGGAIRAFSMVPGVAIDLMVKNKSDFQELMNRSTKNHLRDSNNFNSLIDFVESKDPWMRQRFATKHADLYDFVFNKSKMSEFTKSMVFGIFHWTQSMTEIPVWKETYDRAIANGKSEADAIAMAQSNVTLLFGSGRLEDRPNMLQQKQGLMRALNMFATWIYAQTGNVYIAGQQIKTGNMGQRIAAVTYLLGLMAVMPVTSAVISGSRQKDDENVFKFMAREALSFDLRMIPMLNYAARPIATAMTQSYDPFAKMNYTSAYQALEGTLSAYNKSFSEKLTTSEKIERWTKILPAMPKVPYATQFNVWLWNAWDIINGRMDPQFMDFYKRRPKDEQK